MDLILTLVFSIVMLFFMFFPSLMISEFLVKKSFISSSKQNKITLLIDILLSILIGIFLKFY